MSISIIVPTLNEAELIQPLIEHLHERATEAEIIVADGGSTDGTVEPAAALCHRVVHSETGRAAQMNAGAQVARGEILWFLHADVKVPPGCLTEIERVMSNPRIVGGFFRICLPHSQPIYRLTDSFAHYAGLFLRMRCGDHGIFCRRKIFMELGGFPEVPLMEDVEFFRRLLRRGQVLHSNKRIVVSPRRYETIGHARLTFAYGLLSTLYIFGVSLPTLAAIYKRTCCTTRGDRVPAAQAIDVRSSSD
jgi:rSAM/selenodomain-associated transferase 2